MKAFLSDTDILALRQAHRSQKDRRSADRIKAVLLANAGWTFLQIAQALLIDDETVSDHVHDYIKSKKLSINSGGSIGRLDITQTNDLITHLEANTYFSAKDICAYVKTEFGIGYTVAGMTSWLHQHKFSFKMPKGTPAKADPARQAEFIRRYNDLMNHTPEDEPILFADGVHPTMATKITCGWIRTGQDKPIATQASRTRVNIMGSLNLQEMKIITTTHDTINSPAMCEHFEKLRKTYPGAPKIHVILDNGPYNVSKETKESASKYGIKLHFLPPYSPNLNPIERVWKVMNEHVRNNVYFKNAKEFRQAIMYFFNDTWSNISNNLTDRINDNFQIINSAI